MVTGRRTHLRWLPLVLIALGLAGLLWWPAPREDRQSEAPRRDAPATPPAAGTFPSTPATPADPGPQTETGAASLVLRIERAGEDLQALARRPESIDERRALVFALRTELRAAGQAQAAEAIIHFLESGRDVATGLVFGPAPDGFLETPSSLRTLLIDELERASPELARDVAQDIFAHSPNADEWALALRITARTNPPDSVPARQAFVSHAYELLTNAGWRGEPTAGFLHAFDAAVYSRDPVFVPPLSELAARPNSDPAGFAARLALDRMAMTAFSATAEQLLSDHRLGGEPEFRGLLFARADVSDDAQRQLVERFLTDPATTIAEREAWARFFPHRAKHLSNNLLTRDTPTPPRELARMDRAALATVSTWRNDPALRPIRDLLDPVYEKLQRFVSEADRNYPAPASTP